MSDCSKPPTDIVPICDMGPQDTYFGFFGGLYPDGSNNRPPAHEAAGVVLGEQLAQSINRRLIVLGASGTAMIGQSLQTQVEADPEIASGVSVINAARAGQDTDDLANPFSKYWSTHVPAALAAAAVTASQINVAWIMTGLRPGSEPFPSHAERMAGLLHQVVGNVRHNFQNCKMVYLTSTYFHGYIQSEEPEPGVFEQGFAVKWFLQEIMKRTNAAFWVDWGGYFWTDGAVLRNDGLALLCPQDVQNEGQHPSQAGRDKLAEHLIEWFKNDPTAQPWFLA